MGGSSGSSPHHCFHVRTEAHSEHEFKKKYRKEVHTEKMFTAGGLDF